MGLPPFLASRSTQSLRGCWSPGRYPSAPGELADRLLPPAQNGRWGLRDCVHPNSERPPSQAGEGVRQEGVRRSEMYCKDVLKMCQHHLKHCKLVKRT